LRILGQEIDMGNEKITLMKKFSPRPITERLLTQYSFYYDENKRFWAFNKSHGVWKENAEEMIERVLRDQILGEEMAKRFYVNEVVADVKGLSYHAEPLPEAKASLVPFKNKIYDLGSGACQPFNPFVFIVSKLGVDYNPDTHCPTIDAIFKQVAPDRVDDLYDLIALCLYRGYPVHKFWVLYGPGRNGKSVFARILTSVLGRENVSTVSLMDIEGSRFATSQLFGKFANIGPEQTYEALSNTSRLKQLSGGDMINAERKFGHAFNFTNHAKLIFLTNELPVTNDKTTAFYSRVKIITFPNTFEGEAADKQLVDNIAPDEYEGLAFKCLQRLQDFYSHNFNNVREEPSNSVAEVYERLTDPLTTFLQERTEADVNGTVPKWELSEEFNSWCGEHSFRKWTDHRLSKEMGKRGFETAWISTEEGKRWRGWAGLKWNDNGKETTQPAQSSAPTPEKAKYFCKDCGLFSTKGCWIGQDVKAEGEVCGSFKYTDAPLNTGVSVEGVDDNAQV
jgi:P4 family phage/plasmid primase-like protien